MRRFGLLVAATALLLQAAGARRADPGACRMPCHDYAEIARQLRATYEEAPVSLGSAGRRQSAAGVQLEQNGQLDHRQHLARRHGLRARRRPALGKRHAGEPRPGGLTRRVDAGRAAPTARRSRRRAGHGGSRAETRLARNRQRRSWSWRAPFTPRTAIRCTERGAAAIGMIARGHPLGRAWLIEEAGQTIGYAVLGLGFGIEYGGADAFVDDLYLVPTARGRGLGAHGAGAAGGRGPDAWAWRPVPGGRPRQPACPAPLRPRRLRGHALAADGQAPLRPRWRGYSHSSLMP